MISHKQQSKNSSGEYTHAIFISQQSACENPHVMSQFGTGLAIDRFDNSALHAIGNVKDSQIGTLISKPQTQPN
jgi:hypothetical protein